MIPQGYLSAAVNVKQEIEDYKQALAQVKKTIKKIKDPEEKRKFLEQILTGVVKDLKKVDREEIKEEELGIFKKFQSSFEEWNKESLLLRERILIVLLNILCKKQNKLRLLVL